MKTSTKKKMRSIWRAYMFISAVTVTAWLVWAAPKAAHLGWTYLNCWAESLKTLVPLS